MNLIEHYYLFDGVLSFGVEIVRPENSNMKILIRNLKSVQLTIILAFICFLSLGGCSKYSKEIQANLTKLKKTKACSGCDLSGIELISFDLKNADLSGAVKPPKLGPVTFRVFLL